MKAVEIVGWMLTMWKVRKAEAQRDIIGTGIA